MKLKCHNNFYTNKAHDSNMLAIVIEVNMHAAVKLLLLEFIFRTYAIIVHNVYACAFKRSLVCQIQIEATYLLTYFINNLKISINWLSHVEFSLTPPMLRDTPTNVIRPLSRATVRRRMVSSDWRG